MPFCNGHVAPPAMCNTVGCVDDRKCQVSASWQQLHYNTLLASCNAVLCLARHSNEVWALCIFACKFILKSICNLALFLLKLLPPWLGLLLKLLLPWVCTRLRLYPLSFRSIWTPNAMSNYNYNTCCVLNQEQEYWANTHIHMTKVYPMTVPLFNLFL